MNEFKKSKTAKVVSGFVGLATAVMMMGPAVVSAATVEELTAQINSLLAQVQALQAAQGSSTVSATAKHVFSANLTVGSKGDDVTALQTFLVSGGYLVMPVGVSMGHFGNLTKAAVTKWQAASGISPAVGYFGPISRAAMNAAKTTTTATTATTPATTPATPETATTQANTVTVTPITGTITVSGPESANQAGTIVSGSAQVPVLNFTVSNGTDKEVTLSAAKFTKMGVISDSNISNVYVARGNRVIAQYNSLTQGIATFGPIVTIPAGTSMDLNLRVDISSGTGSSNTVTFSIVKSSDLTFSSGTASGDFPIQGGQQFISSVSNPSLAEINSPTYQAVATQVDAGTNGFRGSSLSFTVLNSPVKLLSMNYTLSGSTNLNDLANMTLRIDGQVVGTASPVGTDGKAFFDLTANAPTLSTGSHQVEVYTDVMGTPNRNFKFEILRPYDVIVIDTAYNTNLTFGTPSGTASSVSVRQGTGTVSLDKSTPTGNLPRGGSNVTLAKFAIRASGEALRLKWLPFQITQGGSAVPWSTIGAVDSDIRNISIFTDVGDQIGTTINTPSTCTYGTPVLGATTYQCSVGSPTSNVNYIIPANTVRIFSVRADIQAGGDVTSLSGALIAPAGAFAGNNAEGQVSFQTSSIPGGTISGSNLTISASPFQASQNTAFSSQTYVQNAQNKKIASFSLGASSAEDVKVTSVTVLTSADVNNGNLKLQNLSVKVGTAVWDFIVPTISGSTAYTFSSPSFQTSVPAGGTLIVDVYADVLSGSVSGPYTNPLALVGAVGIGAKTNTNQVLRDSANAIVSTTIPVAGQNLTVAGTGILTATVDSSLPPAQQIVLGALDAPLARFRFVADNNEDLKVDQFTLTASSTLTTAPATFKNLKLYNIANPLSPVATGQSLTGSLGVYTSLFSVPVNPLVVAKNQTNVYEVRGDVSTFTESTNSVNKAYNFSIAASSSIRVFGDQSTVLTSTAGTFPLVANTQTTLRTKLTATIAPTGAVVSRARTATDDLSNLTLKVDNAYGAEFKAVTFKLSGAAVPVAPTTISLVDADTGIAVVTTTGTATTSATLTLPTPFLITQGQTKVYRVRVDSSNFLNASNTSDSFSIQVVGAADLVWQTQGLTETLGLETKAIPLTSTVSYE